MKLKTSITSIAAWWFTPRVFEAGSFYRWLGIVGFKRLFMAIVGRSRLRSNYGLEGKGAASLRNFERWTRVYESYHLVLGVLIAGIVVWGVLARRQLSVELIVTGCL